MRLKALFLPFVLLGLAACVYVTDEESSLLSDWDRDGFDLDQDCDDGNDMIFPKSPHEVYGDGLDFDCDGYDDPVCAWRLQYVESCDTAPCTADDITLLQDWFASGADPVDFPESWILSGECATGLGL